MNSYLNTYKENLILKIQLSFLNFIEFKLYLYSLFLTIQVILHFIILNPQSLCTSIHILERNPFSLIDFNI